MPVEVRVPALGESIVEATVGSWRKQEGEPVQAGEVLVELETDKVNVEVSAPEAGVLGHIIKAEGETVGIGDILTTVEQAAGTPAAATQEQSKETVRAEVTPAPTQAPEAARLRDGAAVAARATPLAQRVAAERGVDLAAVTGSGPGGQIRQEDVSAYLAAQPSNGRGTTQAAIPAQPASRPAVERTAPAAPHVAPPSAPAPAGRPEERIRLSRRRQTIAQRLVETQHTAAMLTTFNEVDMTAIMDVRARRRDAFKERHQVSLGFMSFFTRAVVGALKSYPRLNAEIQGDEMVLKRYFDVGIAVSTDEGLVVPVVRDADHMTFAEVERAIATLAEKARSRTLSLEELQGGTFTITNGGVFGSLLSTPILNGPQAGILGMHKIQERPVAFQGSVMIRPMMYVALSYDHRIVDGAEAVSYLVRVKELLEDPERLLLEV
jgi:2-oxoglutarate dehydrogenase E2 component (dihydrolipoamide succinyltransferase)